MSFSYKVQHAELQWDALGLPYAPDFEDVYYSRNDALGESSYVFLEGNQLPARFASLENKQFIIAELGFGAGLNFLNTCRLWCEQAPAAATLHYIACELYPLRLSDLRGLHARFPELADYSATLLNAWPQPCRGVQQLQLRYGEHRIVLSLLHEAASELAPWLAGTPGLRVDAWFLDGFSPAHNPDMWSPALFQNIAGFCHTTTTLCSYSVAGSVRRGLEEAGFVWEKLPGFAGKRHMLRATLPSADTHAMELAEGAARTICVVGAGLAGCSTARALAESGWQVVLLDSAAAPASAASGNPQGILHFKPATADSMENRFNLHAWLYASRFYGNLALPPELWSPCGMMQLAQDERFQKRLHKLEQSGLYDPDILQILDAEQASRIAGADIEHRAVYFPAAGWLQPKALCNWYAQHPGISLHCNSQVLQVEMLAEGWQVRIQGPTEHTLLQCRHVILCNALDVHSFSQARHIPVLGNRGQVDSYHGTASDSTGPVICGQGYLIPPRADGLQCIGGSFSVTDGKEQQAADSAQHLQQLAAISAPLAARFSLSSPSEQRRATRCTLADRMPLCGLLAGSPEGEAGLWVNVAHGSQGLARTPLCAALLDSHINRTPSPLEACVQEVLRADRFRTD